MDPELEAFVALFPSTDLADPVAARERFAGLAAAVPVPDLGAVEVRDLWVPGGGPGGGAGAGRSVGPEVPVRVYRPEGARGAVVWLHGGGFTMGDVDTEHPWAARLAVGSGAVVVSVGHRQAPEDPFPAGFDDAFAVLEWTVAQAEAWGIDPERIAVGGHSSGGGIAAAVALRARDEGGPAIRFQLLNQPCLDDRLESWSARHAVGAPWFDRDKLAAAWRHYLGGRPGVPYAAPARAVDLSGLPAAYIATAEFCPNRDEDLAYGMRLLEAGVSVELHQWAGAFHGSQAILSAEVSQRQNAELGAVLRRALG
ncbi:alpha/beta hydrolase [Streptomyces sp. NPDC097619]|uniref:alpha/beta hydrolase n=1 Tax=Streptomyces sp. NPDC097619 TaxID=3157228 RepID=UPI00331AEF5B